LVVVYFFGHPVGRTLQSRRRANRNCNKNSRIYDSIKLRSLLIHHNFFHIPHPVHSIIIDDCTKSVPTPTSVVTGKKLFFLFILLGSVQVFNYSIVFCSWQHGKVDLEYAPEYSYSFV